MTIAGKSTARTGLAAAVVDGRVFVVGGHNGESPLKTMEVFTPGPDVDSEGEWKQLPPMLARRSYPSADMLSGCVYVVGGSADGRTLNTFEVFDVEKNEWSHWFTRPPMQTKRTLHASAVHGGRLFICGGFDGLRDLATVECFNPAEGGSWQWKSSMSLGRSYLTLGVAESAGRAGCIYAIGGQDRGRDAPARGEPDAPRAHAEIEIFDLYSERWIPGPTLQIGRIAAATATLKHENGREYVYATGGSNGLDVINSVERLDVQEGGWMDAPPMSVERLGHAAVVVGNRLYVIGGYDGKEALDTFECFDPILDRWGPPHKIVPEALAALMAGSKPGTESVPVVNTLPDEAVGKFQSAVRWNKSPQELSELVSGLGATMQEAALAKDSKTGNAALHIAAQQGHRELVQFLVEQGSDLNCQNHFGHTALHMSVEYSCYWISKYLLGHGADPKLKNTDGHEAITGLAGHRTDDLSWDSPMAVLVDARDDPEELDHALGKVEKADPSTLDKSGLVRVGMLKAKEFKHWDKPRFMNIMKKI